MEKVPAALEGARRSYRRGLDEGTPGGRRQAEALGAMCRVWSEGYFTGMVGAYDGRDDAARWRLETAAIEAQRAYRAVADYLRGEYAARADPRLGVGEERYARWVRLFNGIDLDARSTYAWGWEEL